LPRLRAATISTSFGEGTIPRAFRLVDTQLASTGAVLHVYERAGDLRYGEVDVDKETVIFDSDGAPPAAAVENARSDLTLNSLVRGKLESSNCRERVGHARIQSCAV